MTTSVPVANTNNLPNRPCRNDYRLQDIVKSLPKECFEQDSRKAWLSVFSSVLAVGLGYLLLAVSPWFLLPLGWILTGTAATGFFVIGHDCAHRSFAKRIWVNDLVGHFFMMFLIYPFHSWRILHNYHHTHTNKLNEDNAWHPTTPQTYASWDKATQWGFRKLMGNGLWWIGSIVHWAVLHFNWTKFRSKDKSSVRFSVFVVIWFAAIAFPTLIATTGIWGFVKFWLMPWLVYHFWMSTFTLVHHTAPDIPFVTASEWNPVVAQLSGTVHCNYPRWIEFLCHDINVHVPHHVSTAIPSYNLRFAYRSLQQQWGEYLRDECEFSWSLMKQIIGKCNLYDLEDGYLSFEEYSNQQ